MLVKLTKVSLHHQARGSYEVLIAPLKYFMLRKIVSNILRMQITFKMSTLGSKTT